MSTHLHTLSSAFFAALILTIGQLSLPARAAPNVIQSVGSSKAFQVAMDGSMAAMDHAMMSAPRNGNSDHDFASMMIPHHLGAVDMARVELLYGKNPVLRRLAQRIIVTQQQKVIVMKQQIAAPAKPARLRAVSRPTNPESVPVSGRDRVYSGDQTSDTILVIEPATNTLLGVIRLGDPLTERLW